jgi:potassium-transporting ATPase ATP-binding subunit
MSTTAAPASGAASVTRARRASVFSREIVLMAIRDAFPKLDPRLQFRNPVMFIVELGSVITTATFFIDLARGRTAGLWFVGVIAFWLWLTVLFANFAEAVAEGRGKAQANALRATRTTTTAHRRLDGGALEDVPAPDLQRGDVVVGGDRSAVTGGTKLLSDQLLTEVTQEPGKSRPVRSSPPTARSSRASARWTSRRSPASPRR